MSAPVTAPVLQPKSFAFSAENLDKAKKIIAKYPAGRQQSAVMPLLDLAQRQHQNWLPRAAMDKVAELLGMAPIRVYEVASFYSMYNLAPVGKHVVNVCTTTPCQLNGANEVVSACKSRLGVRLGETSADGQFTLREVECLGACVNAPVVQIGDDYYEDVSPTRAVEIIDALARGETPKPGSQTGRRGSCAHGGQTTLKEVR